MISKAALPDEPATGMNGVREWLQNRFGALEFVQTAKKTSEDRKRVAPLHSTVITPQSVPEFVIPLTGSDVLRLTHSLNDMKLNDFSFVCNATDKHDSSFLQRTQESISEEQNSGESSTTKTQKGKTKRRNIRKTNAVARMLETEQASNDGSSSESGTNDDLKSAAAVSLPHLRTFTSFGFTTLKESPHTRRKESLLLGTSAADDVRKIAHSQGRLSPFDEGSFSSTPPSRYTNSASPNNLSVPRAITPSLSINSLASDLGISSADLPMFAYCQPARKPSPKIYKRRRSSTIPWCSESVNSVDSHDTASSRSLSREEARLLAPLGEIKLSLVYNRNESTLKLSIIKAENLASRVSDPEFLSIFIKTSLLPNKAHRQTSQVVKGTHNPHFNQQFIFKHIKMSCFETKYLRLKVCNQLTARKYETLGEVLLQLDTLRLQHGAEVRMWRDLDEPSTNHMLGSVRFSATFQPRKDNLNVTVIDVKSLPRQSLSRAPDPYVKVMVKQDRMQVAKKQTKSQKNTTNAEFDETFNFTISPNVEALRYTTVTIQVLSKERLRNDSVLGQVTLGYSSITNTELLHWTQVLGSPNVEVEQVHKLRPLKCKG